MAPTIYSFGYKMNGQDQFATTGPHAPVIFDCRVISNPHQDAKLRRLTGRDKAVQRRVMKSHLAKILLDEALEHLMEYPDGTVAFGCSYGKHRSVALAELLHKSVPQSTVIHTGAVSMGRNAQ